jgi:nucleolar pre-ribosomal-associated protein 2
MTGEVAHQWRQDLKRFLNRSLILPARAAFLNKGDLEIIRLTIQSTSAFSTLSCPVILDLTLSSPSLAGSQTSKRDNDSWTLAVFSLLDETLQSSRSKHKSAAVHDMLNQVKKHEVSLSAKSLRSVCKTHALQAGRTDWSVLLTIAEINPDVFIIRDGDDLLGTVLERISLDAPTLKVGYWRDEISQTIQTIAAGFARARDPSGFVKIWFQHLAAIGPHTSDVEDMGQYRIWYNEELCKTIAQSLEKTMNTKQILSLVDWLDSQADKPAENAAVILLLEALSQGITQDDVSDSVGMRLFDIVFNRNLPSSVNVAILRRKWTVARRSLQWATLEQGHEIWDTSVTRLRDTLTKGHLADRHVFEAFKFAVAAWIANHPGGKYEDDTAKLTLSSLSQLDDIPVVLPHDWAEHCVIGYLTHKYGGWSYDDRDACPRLLR